MTQEDASVAWEMLPAKMGRQTSAFSEPLSPSTSLFPSAFPTASWPPFLLLARFPQSGIRQFPFLLHSFLSQNAKDDAFQPALQVQPRRILGACHQYRGCGCAIPSFFHISVVC